jgi:hypothetical protein
MHEFLIREFCFHVSHEFLNDVKFDSVLYTTFDFMLMRNFSFNAILEFEIYYCIVFIFLFFHSYRYRFVAQAKSWLKCCFIELYCISFNIIQ